MSFVTPRLSSTRISPAVSEKAHMQCTTPHRGAEVIQQCQGQTGQEQLLQPMGLTRSELLLLLLLEHAASHMHVWYGLPAPHTTHSLDYCSHQHTGTASVDAC